MEAPQPPARVCQVTGRCGSGTVPPVRVASTLTSLTRSSTASLLASGFVLFFYESERNESQLKFEISRHIHSPISSEAIKKKKSNSVTLLPMLRRFGGQSDGAGLLAAPTWPAGCAGGVTVPGARAPFPGLRTLYSLRQGPGQRGVSRGPSRSFCRAGERPGCEAKGSQTRSFLSVSTSELCCPFYLFVFQLLLGNQESMLSMIDTKTYFF